VSHFFHFRRPGTEVVLSAVVQGSTGSRRRTGTEAGISAVAQGSTGSRRRTGTEVGISAVAQGSTGSRRRTGTEVGISAVAQGSTGLRRRTGTEVGISAVAQGRTTTRMSEENVNSKLHPYRHRLWRKGREMASAASGRSNGDKHLKDLSLQVQIKRRTGEGERCSAAGSGTLLFSQIDCWGR
jgi:hypothetical protein